MKKIIILSFLLLTLTGCNKEQEKSNFTVNSTDNFHKISKETTLDKFHSSEIGIIYSSSRMPDSIDKIDLKNYDFKYQTFRFSPQGTMCSTSASVSTKEIDLKSLKAKYNSLLVELTEIYGVPEKHKDTDLWEINEKNGIKSIYLYLDQYSSTALTFQVIFDSERDCDAEIAEQEKKGKWVTSESIDKIDDSKSYSASLFSNSKIQETLLTLRCQKNTIDIFLAVDDYLGTGKSQVSIRLDKNTPITKEWIIAPRGNFVYYTGDTKSILKEMLNAKQLTTRINTYNSQVTSTFDLDKIEYATKDIIQACNINLN